MRLFLTAFLALISVFGAEVILPPQNISGVTNIAMTNGFAFEVDTWAKLKALTIPANSGRLAVLLKGRVTTNDGGGGPFFFTPGAGATDDGGTIATPNVGTGAWFRQFNGAYSPMWFGAIRDGVANDHTALVATFAACPSGGVVDLGSGTYLNGSSITISKAVTIVGTAKILSTTGALVLTTGNFTVSGIDFETAYAGNLPPVSISGQSSNLSNINISNCRFGRMIMSIFDDAINDGRAANTNITISGCTFSSDFTGATAGDTCNIIDVRGWNGVIITGNHFLVTGPERLISVGGSSRDILIENNVLESTSQIGKQSIQTFIDGRQCVINGNIFKLAGTWTSAIEGKSGFDASVPPKLSEITDHIISNNEITIASSAASCDVIGVYGPWGLNATTSVTLASCLVNGNTIHADLTNSLDAVIQLRGFNSAMVENNSVDRVNIIGSGQAIEVGNNSRSVVANNGIRFGGINVFGNRNAPDGTIYTNSPLHVIIDGNVIGAVNGLAPVFISNLTNASAVTITGNSLSTTNNASTLALIYASTSTITNLQINANSGLSDGAYVSTGAATVNNYTHGGNSWEGNPASASANLTAGTIPIATGTNTLGNSHWLGSATYLTPDGDATIQAGSTTNRIAGLFIRPLNASSNTVSLYDSSGTIASVFGPAGGLTLGGQVPPGAGNLNLSGNVQSGGYMALGATASTPDVFLTRTAAGAVTVGTNLTVSGKVVVTEIDGTGTTALTMTSGGGSKLQFDSSHYIQLGGNGIIVNADIQSDLVPHTDSGNALGSAAKRWNGLTSTIYTANAGSISSDTPNVFSQQLNSGGTTFHVAKIVATNTASAAASELLQFLGGAAGTTEVASVRVDGQITGQGLLFGTDNASDIGANGANRPRTIYMAGSGNFASGVRPGAVANSIITSSANGTIEFLDNTGLTFSMLRFGATTTNVAALSISNPGTGNSTIKAMDATGVNMIGFGSRKLHATKTANYPIVAGDSSTTFDNNGASGEVDFTLLSASNGSTVADPVYTFVRVTAQTFKIIAPGSDTISIGSSTSAAGGNITLDTAGATVTLERITQTGWYATASIGTVTVN